MRPTQLTLAALATCVAAACSSPLVDAPFDVASADDFRAVGTVRDDLWAVRLSAGAATELHHFDGSTWKQVKLAKSLPPRLELATAGQNRVWIAGQNGLLWRVEALGSLEDLSPAVEAAKLGSNLSFHRGVSGLYLVGQPAGQAYGGPGTLARLTEGGPVRLMDLPLAPPLLVLANDRVWIHPSPQSPKGRVNDGAEWKDLENGPFRHDDPIQGLWFSAADDVFVGTGDGNQKWVIWHFDGTTWNLEAFPAETGDETRRDFFSAGSGRLAVLSIRESSSGSAGDLDLLARVWDQTSLGDPVTLGALYAPCNGTFCRTAKVKRVDSNGGTSSLLQGSVRGDGEAARQALFFVTPGDL